MIEGNTSPSVENSLEIAADTFAIGVDLISFSFLIDVLLQKLLRHGQKSQVYLERESNDKEIDDESLAVIINFWAKIAWELLQEGSFFWIYSLIDLPTTVVKCTPQDYDFVLIEHKDLE